ncbi:MAG: class I SAM-dependent methyltransferase, partial [Deltaproteobacteria bacterium]|nr:class I SAM-dependent methyltransferase [Deltaproteobacteria bacterium]
MGSKYDKKELGYGTVGRVSHHPVWRTEYKPYCFGDKWPYPALHASIELHYMYRTALRLGKGNYANLGVYHGASTHALAHGAAPSGGHVYGVDIFKRTLSTPKVVGKEALDAAFAERGFERFVTLHEGTTNECSERLKDTKFKFIFIDADHSYKAVL